MSSDIPQIPQLAFRFSVNIVPRKMVWQEAAQLPDIYNMSSRFAGLRPVSIVTHMIFLCVALHAAFTA
ncbi:hypothetical protein F9169_17790 [Escherichia coli]|nr:hypothetical protein [Escherichia coli]EFC4445989.1 hypothetical protein [Escherichia coli]EFH8762476.1 hypothetical protein [Escherichia coli]KAB2981799.1 hypothetical protein F9202_17275 [Escherichia coli]KAB3008712.1 hypothetical protein F9169_17790 [Escherichia coli]